MILYCAALCCVKLNHVVFCGVLYCDTDPSASVVLERRTREQERPAASIRCVNRIQSNQNHTIPLHSTTKGPSRYIMSSTSLFFLPSLDHIFYDTLKLFLSAFSYLWYSLFLFIFQFSSSFPSTSSSLSESSHSWACDNSSRRPPQPHPIQRLQAHSPATRKSRRQGTVIEREGWCKVDRWIYA